MTDVMETHSLRVVCDGGSSTLGHPRVFLTIKRELREVICPYCSRHYVLQETAYTPSMHQHSSI